MDPALFPITPYHRLLRFAPVWVMAAVCLLQVGCAQKLVKLREHPYNPLAERLKLYARGGPKPSERTAQLLRRMDLNKTGHSPSEQLAALGELHEQDPSLESCYALAELSYIAGKKLEIRDRRRALGLFWQTVSQSYAYLFDARYAAARNHYDPQFRGASDLYNAALESCLRITRKEGLLKPGQQLTFEVAGRPLSVSIVLKGFDWPADEFDRFEFVSDYKMKRLTNQHRGHGLGVPLIAVRRKGKKTRPEVEQYYADGLSFPVTAFLRLEANSAQTSDINRPQSATLELHNPLKTTEIVAAGSRIPLETDLSTPLAYFLNNPAMRHLDTLGLFLPNRVRKISGLYMVQPYQPGKIPVLMVHGLWSSPMTWMEMFNDLRSMPEIRERYQFWFYLYPTGEPFWETTADLREDLAEMRDVFDPDHREPALDRMVLVGHSMGGLIARMLTLESGDRFWNAVSDTPIQQVSASDATKARIHQVYFFEPQPSVRSIITISSPFRGSSFANRLTRWLSHRLIFLPQKPLSKVAKIVRRDAGNSNRLDSEIVPTSIDSLSPRSPILQAMLQAPEPSGVKHFNIVGILEGIPFLKDTDGVVPYSSAHFDGAETEIVVNADHKRVHRHPRAVLAVRQFLLEHANAHSTQSRDNRPVRHADAILHFQWLGHSAVVRDRVSRIAP